MAGSYTAKIKFTADTATLQRMERDMGGRFDRISKRFGQGLNRAVKMISFGALATAGAAALTALLNPFEEINQQLNDTLEKADNIKDQAGSLGTSVKNYLKLQHAAATQGIDEGTLVQMSMRMSDLIGQAKEGDQNVLWQYRNETDMGQALYKVIGDLSKIEDRSKRASLASEIFGGRMTGRLAGLLEAGGFEPLIKEVFSGIGVANEAGSVERLAAMEDQQAVTNERRKVFDLTTKEGMIQKQGAQRVLKAQNEYNRKYLQKQNERLEGYVASATTAGAMADASGKTYALLSEKIAPHVASIALNLAQILNFKDPKDQRAGLFNLLTTNNPAFNATSYYAGKLADAVKNKKSGGPI